MTSAIQLDRDASAPIASSTLFKTTESIARILGFKQHVLKLSGAPLSLASLADGHLLASYARFSLETRLKLPASVASELSDLHRPLGFLGAKAATAEEAADIAALQNGLRRLVRQLGALPAVAKPTVEEMTRAGQFCGAFGGTRGGTPPEPPITLTPATTPASADLGSLWGFIDSEFGTTAQAPFCGVPILAAYGAQQLQVPME